jgi:predicted TIM-barrel fold metal-dependent hydrolase
MDFNTFSTLAIIDGHIHFTHPVLSDSLVQLAGEMNLKRVNLVAIPDQALGNHNPALIHYKRIYPDRTYICGGPDYLSALAAPEQAPQVLADQIRALHAAGFDGIKLLESKPMVRKILGIPLDGPVYAPMWANIEALGLPIVWHVADPQEFWDPQRCPSWAYKNDWFYGDGTYPTLETLYGEVDHILARHPGLKVILAHFFFLSEDLQRAADFLDAHPNVCFDLTPGSEMFFNFSEQPQAARDFFLRYADRLIYGTDIGASEILQISAGGIPRDESLGRAWVVRQFLESEGNYTLPTGVAHWARSGQHLEGIKLPDAVLSKIYAGNFERLFGLQPVPLNPDGAQVVLERLAFAIDQAAGHPVDSPARMVARR